MENTIKFERRIKENTLQEKMNSINYIILLKSSTKYCQKQENYFQQKKF